MKNFSRSKKDENDEEEEEEEEGSALCFAVLRRFLIRSEELREDRKEHGEAGNNARDWRPSVAFEVVVGLDAAVVVDVVIEVDVEVDVGADEVGWCCLVALQADLMLE